MTVLRQLVGKSAFAALFASVAFLVVITTSCGSPSAAPRVFSGNTNVTVLLSSTANDQLAEFGLTFKNFALINKAGTTFPLFANQHITEFMHLNGTIEPMTTVSIPEGVYTAATANIGYAEFTCATLYPPTGTAPGGLLTATYAYGSTPDSQVSAHLPSPITITGKNMGILVKLITSTSATLGSCYAPPGSSNPYSISPTFDVTPVSFSMQGPNLVETGLNGEISSVNAATKSLDMTLPDGQSLSANVNSSTVFQGVNDFSTLTAGMFVTLDAAIQSDGSHLASRIGAANPSTTNLSILAGPVLQTDLFGPTGSGPVGTIMGPQQQGLLSVNHDAALSMPYKFQFRKLPNLR